MPSRLSRCIVQTIHEYIDSTLYRQSVLAIHSELTISTDKTKQAGYLPEPATGTKSSPPAGVLRLARNWRGTVLACLARIDGLHALSTDLRSLDGLHALGHRNRIESCARPPPRRRLSGGLPRQLKHPCTLYSPSARRTPAQARRALARTDSSCCTRSSSVSRWHFLRCRDCCADARFFSRLQRPARRHAFFHGPFFVAMPSSRPPAQQRRKTKCGRPYTPTR